jgi:hypothetical protein
MTSDELNKMIADHASMTASSPMQRSHTSGYSGISPTSLESQRRYSYQEPEQDEQGTYYGYKVLHWYSSERCFISPRYHQLWGNGKTSSNFEPSEHSMFGIHCTKRPDHQELIQYFSKFSGSAFRLPDAWLVRCALWGTVIETEQGFRAQHAKIIGVLVDGNWQSYQDNEESPRTYSSYSPKEEIYWETGPNPD